eukprot:gene23185-26249_t
MTSVHFCQELKYKNAASEDGWLNVKLDILFQIYLGVLRKTVGVKNDELPESISNFHIPSSASVASYLSRVSLLIKTHQCEYMPVSREEGDLHPRYHEQWDTLIHSVVEEGVDDSGIQVPVLNREKALPMPVSAKVTYSDQPSVHNQAQKQQQQQNALSVLQTPRPAEKPVFSASPAASVTSPSPSPSPQVDADAASYAEATRKEIPGRRKISFANAFLDALVEEPPLPTDPGFEEYWQGEGWVNGIHDEDMDKIGRITTIYGVSLIN